VCPVTIYSDTAVKKVLTTDTESETLSRFIRS